MLAVADELSENRFVLRYLTDETDDGLSGKEGSFLICSFWLVSALAIVGKTQRARDLMARLVKPCVTMPCVPPPRPAPGHARQHGRDPDARRTLRGPVGACANQTRRLMSASQGQSRRRGRGAITQSA